jgi:hypothetical protein
VKFGENKWRARLPGAAAWFASDASSTRGHGVMSPPLAMSQVSSPGVKLYVSAAMLPVGVGVHAF